MASVAARKKSVVSSAGLQIDTPVAHNTLLNKAASQSTSLYQQCSALRARLMCIHDFPQFFALASSPDTRQSTDPVSQLWDVFALGLPLCFLFNLLPSTTQPLDVNTDPAALDVSDVKTKKRAIAQFAMAIKRIDDCVEFTVTDLWDRDSTDGLVKVIATVTSIVDQLPEQVFKHGSSSPSSLANPDSSDSIASDYSPNAQEAARNNIIRELVETERKYVQDLEIMQKYSIALSQTNIMNQDSIHYLFPNLNKLLNFQRKFLIRLESTAELPWQDQRWGLHFSENEEEFEVYEPYCGNYTNASDIMLANEQNLVPLNHLINAKSELPAFLIKPIQRICKYPLLLDSLIKALKGTDYRHFEELQAGSAAAKRITDKINEAQRRAENEQTVKALEGRIEDWKGHHLSHFGDLILDDIFVVKKSGVDREYHVFLFEKIILCCKEALQLPPNSRKANKNNSILKKQSTLGPSPLPGQTKKNTPLLLKGRIFLNNVTQAVPVSPRNSTGSHVQSQYALEVWWRGDDDLEYFTLRCRTEEQMKQWETQVNRLIKEAAVRRATDRGFSKIVSQVSNSTSPVVGRTISTAYAHEKTISSSSQSTYPSILPASAPYSHAHRPSPYNSEEQFEVFSNGSYPNGPQGYPPYDGFEFDDDEFEDYPPSYTSSGRGTPVGSRRPNAMSMPPERDSVPGYDRPRAQTEDTNGFVMAQWRNNSSTMPPPPPVSANSGLPGFPQRPTTPYLTSTLNAVSYSSDASFGPGIRQAQQPRLRSQFSSTKLKNVYDGESRSHIPSPAVALAGNGAPPPNRSRSVSQPNAYLPKNSALPPPLPSAPWINRSTPPSTNGNKRGSGSSQSTGESSDYSPNSSSPITPFGSSESSLGGFSPPVKVKVHFHDDIFVIQVPRATEYAELVEKVGRKIRLCGPRRDDGPLRVKYKDEDGDMVSLGSTEDVQMAFEAYRPGGQVILHVT